LIPLLLGATSLAVLLSLSVVEGISIFFLLYFSGFMINSLNDEAIDISYSSYKNRIARSVKLIGRKTLKVIMLLHLFIAIFLSIHLSVATSNPLIFLLVGMGLLLGLGYSTPPFHFKVRGIWHIIALTSSAYFIPMLFLYVVVSPTLSILPIVVILGLTIAQYSMEMGNQAADYTWDKEARMLTPSVRWGLERTLKTSVVATTVGVFITAAGITTLFLASGLSSNTLLFGAGLSQTQSSILLGSVIALLFLGYFKPVYGLIGLVKICKEEEDPDERAHLINARINFAEWQATGSLSAVVAVIILVGLSGSSSVGMEDSSEVVPIQEANIFIENVITDVTPTLEEGKIDVITFINATHATPQEVLVVVESFSADTQLDIVQLNPQTDWEAHATLQIHELDDTTFTVTLFYAQRSIDTREIPSISDLYISDAIIPGGGNIVAPSNTNITITIFNEKMGAERLPGSLEVVLKSSRLISIPKDAINEETLLPGEKWEIVFQIDEIDVWGTDDSWEVFLYNFDEPVDYLKID